MADVDLSFEVTGTEDEQKQTMDEVRSFFNKFASKGTMRNIEIPEDDELFEDGDDEDEESES